MCGCSCLSACEHVACALTHNPSPQTHTQSHNNTGRTPVCPPGHSVVLQLQPLRLQPCLTATAANSHCATHTCGVAGTDAHSVSSAWGLWGLWLGFWGLVGVGVCGGGRGEGRIQLQDQGPQSSAFMLPLTLFPPSLPDSHSFCPLAHSFSHPTTNRLSRLTYCVTVHRSHVVGFDAAAFTAAVVNALPLPNATVDTAQQQQPSSHQQQIVGESKCVTEGKCERMLVTVGKSETVLSLPVSCVV